MSARATRDQRWLRPSLHFPIDIRAVAFDLDGTLVETLPDLHESAVRMLAQMGRPAVTESTVRAYVGDGVDHLVRRLLTGKPDGEPDPALFEKAAEDAEDAEENQKREKHAEGKSRRGAEVTTDTRL